jgi:AmmeMemoRadiSam system protein A
MDTSMPLLDESAQKELLALTRATLENYFKTGRVPEYHTEHPGLLRRAGAFVTLHKGDDLRGCIGMLSGEGELYRTVQHCALSAALEDSRFDPVSQKEIPDLTIEISILSAFECVTDVNLIEVGRHGLVISLGGARGLLLPQVASKYHWDRETFLTQTCRKAGLSAQAWRQPEAKIQIFEAQVFSE